MFVMCTPALNPLVVIVHGGLGGKYSSWHKPGGDFYDALKEQANNLGHELITFHWHQTFGGFLNYELIKAGLKLASFVTDYQKKNADNKIILIAHSYGGHVAYHASRFLNPQNSKSTLKLLQENQLLAFTSLTPQLWRWTPLSLGPLLFTKLFKNKKKKQPRSARNYPIHALYTLGMPHQSSDPMPDFSTIKHLFNLHSSGDYIANYLIGMGKLPKKIAQHPRAVNLNIALTDDTNSQSTHHYPNHEEVHSTAIGQWILHIPHHFDSFTFKKNGTVIFPLIPDQQPEYKVHA